MHLLNLSSPHGTAWQLLASVVVVIAAPIIVERVRIPGLIGLLAGGCIIGPNVLGIVSSSDGVLKDLGELGLLYLMFLAGLELDLGVFARYRRQAAGFCLLTFFIPFALGIGAGFVVGYGATASVLLGSLFASYTLVVYPNVRNMGLSANGAVATTVGATVLTDTMALVVLATIAGSTTGDANGLELIVQIVLGLGLLAGFCFLVLPRIAHWFFVTLGAKQTLRYVFVLAALLSAGVLAECLGIEPIVGAFFAGLALNRMVPNEGEFMERIEFFGSALLIPMFLVSVGTVIDPAVLIDVGTLGVALAFVIACVGGKAIAAVLCGPLFKFTRQEVGVVFGLSVAQAAATLAATFVGLQIGLFTSTTVNAVMIVIVVSLVLASTSVQRFGPHIPKPETDETRIGRSVLVHVNEPGDVRSVLGLAANLANADSGVVRPVVVVADGENEPTPELLGELERTIGLLGIDAHVEVRHDRSTTDGILHCAREDRASLIVVAAATQSWLPALVGASQHALVASARVPTALVRPGQHRPRRVVLALSTAQARRPTTAAHEAILVAQRMRASGLELVVVSQADLAPAVESAQEHAQLVIESPVDWLAREAGMTDLVVVPGGRNGALATARTTKLAATKGCTVAVIADRESVSITDRASEGLGLVTTAS